MFSHFYQLPFNGKDHACLLLTGMLTASLFGLVAVWAGWGRTHRVARLAVLWLLVGALVLVPAYDLALLFLGQTMVVVVPLMLVRRFRAKGLRESAKFGVRDVLILTLVITQLAALAAAMPADAREHWIEAIGYGAAFGLTTLLAVWLALGRRTVWVRWVVGAAILPSALLAAWAAPYRNVPTGVAPLAVEIPQAWALALMAVVPAGLYITAALACWRAASERRSRLVRRLGGAGASLLSLAIVVPLTAAYYHLVVLTPIPPDEPLPGCPDLGMENETSGGRPGSPELQRPNGYEQLILAGKSFEKVTIPEKADGPAAISAFVAQHGAALADARKAMKLPGRVPIKYNKVDLEDHIAAGLSLQALARGFHAEALAAVGHRRTDDAIQSCRDLLRLGQCADAGGLLIDWLLARGVNNTGIGALTDLRSELSAPQCRQVIAAVRDSEAAIQPVDPVIKRDRAWEERAFGWRARLKLFFEWLRQEDERVTYWWCEDHMHTRWQLLQAELAVRAYHLEKGRLPQRLESLVPDYLPEPPWDSFSGGPLVYRLEDDGYLLYSVGPDRTDDGGRRQTCDDYPMGPGDLFLDAPKEPP